MAACSRRTWRSTRKGPRRGKKREAFSKIFGYAEKNLETVACSRQGSASSQRLQTGQDEIKLW